MTLRLKRHLEAGSKMSVNARAQGKGGRSGEPEKSCQKMARQCSHLGGEPRREQRRSHQGNPKEAPFTAK